MTQCDDTQARREDVVVSLCFPGVVNSAADFAAVRSAADSIAKRYRFYEIIVLVEAEAHDAYLSLVQSIANLRLFAVAGGISTYYKRIVAAGEAIGDVVLLSDPAEVDALDIITMADRAADDGCIILSLRYGGTDLARSLLTLPLIGLGRAGGFKVNTRQMRSAAFPRTILNQLLTHSDPALALRFPPRDVRLPLGYVVADPDRRPARTSGAVHRLQLMHRLLIFVAPVILILVTLASAMLFLSGVAFAVYVVAVQIFVSNLAEGWLTTAVMLSVMTAFMGFSICGLSLAAQNLLMRRNADRFENVAYEINRVDLFRQVASDLNVDLDRDPGDRASDAA